ncbi:MAG: alpha/beta hydrolase [Kutzneria sp.]|nr:alpha/beta hydrolase [Kutzneria sp.]
MIVDKVRLTPAVSTGRRPHALVFSPVLARWDDGRFFGTVTGTLTAVGYRVTVVDTLATLDASAASVRDLARKWIPLLPELEPADLVVGNALGGALAQVLACVLRPPHGIVLVSAPTRADNSLAEKLSAIIEFADRGRLRQALALLERLVLPADTPPGRPLGAGSEFVDESAACRRVAGGLRLLVDVDVSAEAIGFPGALMHVVGARSQLVTTANVVAAAHHEIVSVPGAGMRPHVDRPAFVSGLLTRFVAAGMSR